MLTMEGNVQLVNCDWLQFWCLWHTWDPAALTRKSHFKVVYTQRGTRVFKEVYKVIEKSSSTISKRDEQFATLAMVPYSSVIDAKMVLVKIENYALYRKDLYKRILMFLHDFDFEYKNITRLDLCCDFKYFANGWLPNKLLKYYYKNDIIKKGSRRYSVWSTAPYSYRQMPHELNADTLSKNHEAHCVSWGGAQSDVHVKMYNKSKEIKDESHKHYIKTWWKRNGLVEDADVWRVEISFGGRSRCLVDKGTGEFVPISLLEATANTYIRETFLAMASRHFAFVDTRGQHDPRRCPDVDLWEIKQETLLSPVTAPSKEDPSRTAKVCMNWLEKLPKEMDLSAFVRSDLYPIQSIERMLQVLSDIYHYQAATKHDRQRFTLGQLRAMEEERNFLAMFGVPLAVNDVQKLESMEEVLNSEQKTRQLQEELYVAFKIAKEGIIFAAENDIPDDDHQENYIYHSSLDR